MIGIYDWHLFFCIFENSGEKHGPGLLRSVSSTLPSQPAPNLPISWCNLVAIQLSIKISMWMAVFHFWICLDLQTNRHKCLKWSMLIWKNGWPISRDVVVFKSYLIRRLRGPESPTFVNSACLYNIVEIPSSWRRRGVDIMATGCSVGIATTISIACLRQRLWFRARQLSPLWRSSCFQHFSCDLQLSIFCFFLFHTFSRSSFEIFRFKILFLVIEGNFCWTR